MYLSGNGRVAAIGGQDEQTVGLQLSLCRVWRSRLPFKPNIRTILENFPKGLLWCGSYIYFGRKVLYDLVYYQRVMTFLENKKGKDFWSLK